MAGSKVIAVDLGGTNLRVGLVKGRKVLKYLKKPTPNLKSEILKVLVDTINEICDGKFRDIKGIGVASPGPLKNGIIGNTPNLALKHFNLRGFLQKKFKKKVVLRNDADCVALSEAKYGCKKTNFFILTLGTGIGGGIIIDGELIRGGGYAGELGHIIIHNGRDLEYYWKENRTQCKKCFGKILLMKELLKNKDRNAKKILDDSSKYLGQGIASLIHVFDPEIVVLMGGIREAGIGLLNRVKKEVRKYLHFPKMPPIVWSELDHPGILGASLLIK